MHGWLVSLTDSAWRQCWQVTLLIAIAWLVVKIAGHNRPHFASVLWLLVLLKCVTPPIWSSPSGIFCWLQSRSELVSNAISKNLIEKSELPEVIDDSRASNDEEADAIVVQVTGMKNSAEPVQSPPTEEQVLNAPRTTGSVFTLLWMALAVWLVGCAASIVTASNRLRLCWRELRSAATVTDSSLEAMLNNLRIQLGIKRTVQLWITDSRIGPAVIGIWRPVVILPSVLVRRKSPRELVPLLAHELVHIRRGDLWIGMLQMLAQSLWWFHPLVRLACRWFTREAERCCDEAVIALLACTPAAYARTLLDVVALKQQLHPLPSFPGVRPVDVTRGRLERIMQLRQGCLQRTPWWCWLVLALAAAALLPGAALVIGPREQARKNNLAAPRADLMNSKRIAMHQFEPDDVAAEQQVLLTKTYAVADLLARLISDRGETPAAAREHLAAIVQSCAPGPWEITSQIEAKPGEDAVGLNFVREAQLRDNPAKRSLGWSNDSLVVRQSEPSHIRIERQLAALRRHGFSELTVEVKILSGPVIAIDQISTNWKLIGATADDEWGTESRTLPETENRDQNHKKGIEQIRGTVESLIEKQVPALIAFLDHDETQLILGAAQDSTTTNILSAPNVVVFNGQSARIMDTTQRPFVVGVKPTPNGGQEPQVRVVSEGTSIRLRPELLSDDSVQLDLGLTLSHIRGVETAEFGRGTDSVMVQVPEVGMTKLKSTIDMKLNQTLAISLPSITTGKEFKGGCILVNVRKSPAGSQQAAGSRMVDYSVVSALHSEPAQVQGEPGQRTSNQRLIEKIYPVADLVVPIPGDPMVVYLLGARPAVPRVNSTVPDFDSLIEMLTTTVAPRTWKQNGGVGTIASQTNRLSLLICTTEEVHVQVANCLESLHRMQDTQICWAIDVFKAKPSDFAKWASSRNDESLVKLAVSRGRLAVLAPDAVLSLRDKVASKEAIISAKDRIHSLKVTGFLGQAPDFRFPSKEDSGLDLISRAQFQATVSSNLRTMRVMLGIHGANAGKSAEDNPTWSQPFNLPIGHSVLFDLDPGANEGATSLAAPTLRRLFLLTPQLLLATNEEYLRTLSPVEVE
jgi:beta-lactamase regulating signal transducer with metallopeptidase domain